MSEGSNSTKSNKSNKSTKSKEKPTHRSCKGYVFKDGVTIECSTVIPYKPRHDRCLTCYMKTKQWVLTLERKKESLKFVLTDDF